MRLLGGVDLGDAHALRRVDHLALQVRQVDLVVVDDAERADAGRGEVQGRGRAEPSGAQQQHLRVEQLLLALDADLRDQQVPGVAVALFGAHRPGHLDLVAAVLPQGDAAGHRAHVLVTEILDHRARGVGGALAGCAIQDHLARAIGHDALDARLEMTPRNALRARQMPGRELFAAANVDDRHALVGELLDLGGVDLLDPALDLAEQLRSGRGHRETPKRRSGFIDFRKYSAVERGPRPVARRIARSRETAPGRAGKGRAAAIAGVGWER